MKGTYVDGFMITIPKKNIAAYKEMAELGKQVWLKYGALDYKECMGDDLQPKAMPDMPAPQSFIDAAKAGKDDTVWFSFIVFKSRAHRDEVNARVMADPSMNDPKMADMPMPFSMQQIWYGGFNVEVGM